MPNPYRELLSIFDPPPLQIGDVLYTEGGVATVELIGGGRVRARGDASAGQRVFVRDGVIEGAAPQLPVAHIEL